MQTQMVMVLLTFFFFLLFSYKFAIFYGKFTVVDVEEVIDMAKRKLEKEREQFMSKSVPSGYSGDNISAGDNESESDDESDESEEKGLFLSLYGISFR